MLIVLLREGVTQGADDEKVAIVSSRGTFKVHTNKKKKDSRLFLFSGLIYAALSSLAY